MKVLFICTELYPFLKTGGLADVCAALPPALQAEGCDVRLLLPAFAAIVGASTGVRAIASLPTHASPWGVAPALPAADIALATMPGVEMPVYLLRAPDLYSRAGNPYMHGDGTEWPDNALRFAALGWAGAHLGQGLDPDWVPDVLHCHDWHTGLVATYVQAFRDAGCPTPTTVFTIHNLAYQGLFPYSDFTQVGLPASYFGIHGVEFYGQMSFMKAGIQHSDRITTVSPNYAREILTPEQGCGLEGLLQERAHLLSGVLNGVDDTVWDPETDTLLPYRFDARRLDGKAKVKRALQRSMGLEERPDALVFGVVSRLTAQKGLHLVAEVLSELVTMGGQLVILGQGNPTLETAFLDATRQYPGQVGVRIGYDEATAHRVFGGADIVLVPSTFEPCGLTQLYALRYGALPLVRRVGGLADTVVDCTTSNMDEGTATGFVFDELIAPALLACVKRAFTLYKNPKAWMIVQRRGMQLQFDWRAAARHYCNLYQALVRTNPLATQTIEE
jgi:starch synthase